MTTDKQMEENILNYAKEIITIESFIEAVRKTVGQYLGYTGNKGFINMIREILQNSIDELMRDNSPCNYIKVCYDARTNTVTNLDNGKGIPFDDIIRIFTKQHTGVNYVKKARQFTSGRHGVGSKVTNAVCSTFTVKSYLYLPIAGICEARMVEFIDGKPSDKGVQVIPNKDKIQGTIITFQPCYEVMGEITTTCAEVLNLISMLLPLTKIGAVIDFEGIDIDGKVTSERLVNEDGIITDLINKTTRPLIKPIILSHIVDTMKADIAFTYDSSDLMTENLTAFSNFCPTPIGTHVDGFITGLTKYFREYMNKIYLGVNSKTTVCDNDIRTGLKGIIAVAHLEPIFGGQAKEALNNEDMKWFVRDLLLNGLTQWAKENPSDLQKMCKYFKEVADNRIKSDNGKIRLAAKYETSSLTGLPKKYIKPNGKKNLELVIVEGDSAAGAGTNVRCKLRQGIFPIRGKIPNVFKTEVKKFLSNEEISGILNLLGVTGTNYGKNFDITKCPFEKIIIGCDADPDGAHIRKLLISFLLVYCPQLIIAGRVYSLMPPLFGIKLKNGKFKYFIDRLDFIKYIQTIFSAEHTLSSANGVRLTNAEALALLYTNMEYVYEIETVANTYAVNPYLLEQCLIHRALDYQSFKSNIEQTYRFINVEKEKNLILVKGLLDSKYQTALFNDKMISNCQTILKYIDRNASSFIIDNRVVSLYGLMKEFDAYKPAGINRYKGLGEMNEQQFAESSLHPDADRTLLRYTVENIEAELAAIRVIESDKSKLLKDIKVCKADVM